MGMPKLYSDKVEKFQWLTIGKGAPNYNFQVAYSLPVSAKKGDIIGVKFEAEITNPQNYTVGVCRYIILGSSPTDTVRTIGNMILKGKGENVTSVIHHGLVVGGGDYEFKEDFDGFVNLVLYADSTAAGSGQQIQLEQGYGQLDIMHFKAELFTPVTQTTPAAGVFTVTAAQMQQIVAALGVGDTQRSDALALIDTLIPAGSPSTIT